MDVKGNKHKYQEGQLVNARFHDWTPDGRPRVCLQMVRIVARVDLPFGYDVESTKAIGFLGNMPFPVSIPREVSEKDGLVSFRHLFVRETDLEPPSSVSLQMLKKLRTFASRLIFREIAAVYTKPPDQIQYINYYAKDGSVSVITDDRKFNTEPDSEKRFAYRVPHFYGFGKPIPGPSYENPETKDVAIHFSMNRFSEVEFWDGMGWGSVDKSKAFRPRKGDLVCGWASAGRNPNAPSFDHWFVCSPQFKTLCYLLCVDGAEVKLGWKRDVTLERLTMPENPNHYYIAHEIPLSRHLYAGIFSLVCGGTSKLPSEWKLPERKAYQDAATEPFEVWWPTRLLQTE